MKVLVISKLYPSTTLKTGGIFVHQQVKELQKQGCEVIVVSPVAATPFPFNYIPGKLKAYSQIPSKMEFDGNLVYYPRFFHFPYLMFLASSGKRMYSGIKETVAEVYDKFKFDIIHAHVALPDGFAGMMLKQVYKKPLLVTIHGQDLQVTINKNAACRDALMAVFQHSDKIITVSSKLKRIAEHQLGFQEKIIVVNNGINQKDIVPINREAMSLSYDRPKTILSVSSLRATKGVDLNIKAISRLIGKYSALSSRLHYTVIGEGPQMSYLQNLVKQFNLEKQVEFLGALPHNQVMEYMAKADVFSLPSWQEGFGIVYLEAMASGLPVIACEGEGITDVIENNKTGILVKPRKVEELENALYFLLYNPNSANEIGQSAMKQVNENFTWHENARKHIRIYSELLANRLPMQ